MRPRGFWGAIVAAALMLTACSSPSPSTGCLVLTEALGEQPDMGALCFRIQYLDESVGSQYIETVLEGGSEAFATLYRILNDAVEQSAETVGALSPESMCNDRILLVNDVDGECMSYYYLQDRNLLVYSRTVALESGTALEYKFYTPDTAIQSLLSEQRQLAAEPKAESNEAYLSPAQLKASIDADDLTLEGDEIGFEFYEDALPEGLGPSCHVYMPGDFDGLSQDKALVVARTTAVDGTPVNLSITGIEMNEYYIKVLVMKPDDSLDEYEAATDYAASVTLSDLNLSRWFVFIDEEGNVLDVLVPEND